MSRTREYFLRSEKNFRMEIESHESPEKIFNSSEWSEKLYLEVVIYCLSIGVAISSISTVTVPWPCFYFPPLNLNVLSWFHCSGGCFSSLKSK